MASPEGTCEFECALRRYRADVFADGDVTRCAVSRRGRFAS